MRCRPSGSATRRVRACIVLGALALALSAPSGAPAEEPSAAAAAKSPSRRAEAPAAEAAEGAGAGVADAAPAASGAEGGARDAPGETARGKSLARRIDDAAGVVVGYMATVLFFDPVEAIVGAETARARKYPSVPLVVLWLILGALSFTVVMGFINVRGFRHSLQLVRGKYTDPHSRGEVSHFQALCAALSATVGLGNIAGVALAVNLGGPGAVFWMVVAAFFGMTSKFTECALGQKYRLIDEHGRVSGGAMHYLYRGLAEIRLGPLGAVLSVLFAILCIGGSLGGGNMYQANQSFDALSSALELEPGSQIEALWLHFGSWAYGLAAATLVGLVIIGGIRRIATAASRIVPLMCAVYVLGSLYIILANFAQIDDAFEKIVQEAFSPSAVKGGFFGVLIIGVQRAAFSNEAGIGSAAIAHSAARTDEPIREGLVALLEPFIDTIVVCTMTGLVVVITGAYELEAFQSGTEGSAITVAAWRTVSPWFPLILAFATMLFAFSTQISWSYYGERCCTYLFGPRSTLPYKVIFLFFVVIGSVIELENVVGFSDMMILGMAFPNLLGCLLLSGKVRADLTSYWRRYRAGEFRKFK